MPGSSALAGSGWHLQRPGDLPKDGIMAETIARAVEQISGNESLMSLDESATKQMVVLRLLGLAGWDIHDMSDVMPEHAVGSRRVDYALLPGTANVVLIEVKRARVNLDDHERQLLEYCFQEGVRMAVLTNGRNWRLYLPMQPGGWEGRRFLDVDITVQPPETVERLLMDFLSREKVARGRAFSDAEAFLRSRQREGVTAGNSPPRSRNPARRPAGRADRGGRGSVLPITLDPEHQEDFLAALLRTKLAWFQVFYADGRRGVRPWNADRMSPSSNVMHNLRSRHEFRQGNWQKAGIVRLHVSIQRPD